MGYHHGLCYFTIVSYTHNDQWWPGLLFNNNTDVGTCYVEGMVTHLVSVDCNIQVPPYRVLLYQIDIKLTIIFVQQSYFYVHALIHVCKDRGGTVYLLMIVMLLLTLTVWNYMQFCFCEIFYIH